jgi:DNA-binding MarR family transcriptional regulator
MLDSGWIRKNRDPDDGRVLRLSTTPKAEALKKELIDLRIKANEELLAGFTPEEKVVFKRLLRDLT